MRARAGSATLRGPRGRSNDRPRPGTRRSGRVEPATPGLMTRTPANQAREPWPFRGDRRPTCAAPGKLPLRENASFATLFSAHLPEGITSCCSILRRAHHVTRRSGNAGVIAAQSLPGILLTARFLETQPSPRGRDDLRGRIYPTSPMSKRKLMQVLASRCSSYSEVGRQFSQVGGNIT